MQKFTFLLGIFRDDNKYLGKLLDHDSQHSCLKNIRALDKTIEGTIQKATAELEKKMGELVDKGERVYVTTLSEDEIERRRNITGDRPICVSPIFIEVPDKTERINITLPGRTLKAIKAFCKTTNTPISNFFTDGAVALMEKLKKEAQPKPRRDYFSE